MRLIKVNTQSGISRPGLLFILAIIGGAVYVGSKVFPFYYNYYELVGLMDAQARVASENSDVKIREVLMIKIKELNIPINADYDLQINRSGNVMSIYLAYTEELWVPLGKKDYKLWEFPFVAQIEQEY